METRTYCFENRRIMRRPETAILDEESAYDVDYLLGPVQEITRNYRRTAYVQRRRNSNQVKREPIRKNNEISSAFDGKLFPYVKFTYLMKISENYLNRYNDVAESRRRSLIKTDDFTKLDIVGYGMFRELILVKHKSRRTVYAMKMLDKYETRVRYDSALFWRERNTIMRANSEWIVQLHFSFEDAYYLYFVIDFSKGGGNLETIINNQPLSEKWAKFYCAELVLAVDFIHTIGFVHRDVTPKNILLDERGHLKLVDFGTCKRMDSDGLVRSSLVVSDYSCYIPPEVCQNGDDESIHGKEYDWWSVGVSVYKMLFYETPFNPVSFRFFINKGSLRYEHFISRTGGKISVDTKNLLRGFIANKSVRLGRNGVDEIKRHPFFKNDQWTFDNIRECVSPFISSWMRE